MLELLSFKLKVNTSCIYVNKTHIKSHNSINRYTNVYSIYIHTYTGIHIYISVSVCYKCLMSISKWSSTHREVSMDLSQAFSCRLGDDEKRAWAREARTIAQPLLCVAFGLLSKSKLSGFGLCCWKSKQTKQKVMIKNIFFKRGVFQNRLIKGNEASAAQNSQIWFSIRRRVSDFVTATIDCMSPNWQNWDPDYISGSPQRKLHSQADLANEAWKQSRFKKVD